MNRFGWPLNVGATFRLTPPDEETITSTVIDLRPGRLPTDLTEMDGLAVRVDHRLDPQPGGGTLASTVIAGAVQEPLP